MKPHADAASGRPTLLARRLGIHTKQEAIVYLRTDCGVGRSEGLSPQSQVVVAAGGKEIRATLHQVSGDLLAAGEAGLSEVAWRRLNLRGGESLTLVHARPVSSHDFVRSRIFGHRLDDAALHAILKDIVAGRYSDIHLASFITACSVLPLDEAETVSLTRAMVDSGQRLTWTKRPIVDKHSVGGLPGNRTTPILVAIVAAHGLTIPKTSSRAITSPSGTADTMETMAPVDLPLAAMRQVVERESGCIVWGGSVGLSPADDSLIRIERALDLDPEGQLVASVLSKKAAAGSTHLVLDVPVGPTAKVRSAEAAELLAVRLLAVASVCGMRTTLMVSDGTQPVGRGIGPALEARDVLAVLQGSPEAPPDLMRRACRLAGALLELGACAPHGMGEGIAERTLADGRAWAKFQRICEAQGGMRQPTVAQYRQEVFATRSGRVAVMNNRRLAKVAKLAGAPDAKAAGVDMHVRLGLNVRAGDALYTIHAQTPGELDYALDYASANADIIGIET
jgi:thymidine phosphorylase